MMRAMRSMSTGTLALASSLAFLAASSAGGCKRLAERAQEKAEERAVQKQTGGQVDIDSEKGTLRIVSDGGAITVGTGSTVPDDFPKVVPSYPGSTVAFAATSHELGKEGWTINLETRDSKDKVAAYYKANLSGFTQASTMELGTSLMQVWQSPKYDVTLILAEEGDAKTSVTLNVSSK
jgi:hypothetical protein